MAKWSFSVASFTPAATADTANLGNQQHMTLQGGSGTQFIDVNEIFFGGLATSSAPTAMTLCRDSQIGSSITALTTGEKNAALSPFTAALAAAQVAYTQTSANKPQRSSTLGLLNLAFNAFGSNVRWVYAPGEECSLYGNTASLGELSLSSLNTGSPGLMSAHMIYEPK